MQNSIYDGVFLIEFDKRLSNRTRFSGLFCASERGQDRLYQGVCPPPIKVLPRLLQKAVRVWRFLCGFTMLFECPVFIDAALFESVHKWELLKNVKINILKTTR